MSDHWISWSAIMMASPKSMSKHTQMMAQVLKDTGTIDISQEL